MYSLLTVKFIPKPNPGKVPSKPFPPVMSFKNQVSDEMEFLDSSCLFWQEDAEEATVNRRELLKKIIDHMTDKYLIYARRKDTKKLERVW